MKKGELIDELNALAYRAGEGDRYFEAAVLHFLAAAVASEDPQEVRRLSHVVAAHACREPGLACGCTPPEAVSGMGALMADLQEARDRLARTILAWNLDNHRAAESIADAADLPIGLVRDALAEEEADEIDEDVDVSLREGEHPTAEEVCNALMLTDRMPLGLVVANWTQEQRDAAYEWAGAEHLAASDNPIRRKPIPPHVAALPIARFDQSGEPFL